MGKNNSAIPKHPSKSRQKVGWLPQLIGLFGAPTAWAGQICFSNILSSYACYPHETPLDSPIWNWLLPELIAISLTCFAIGGFSAYIAWASWQRSKDEAPGGKNRTIEVGDGRTRFLALLGALVSMLFMAAIAFTACGILLVKPC